MSSERQRLPGLDALKGVAIAAVVAIHAAPSDAPAYREYAISGVARLAVPLFLLISGFLVGSRPPSRARAFVYFRKFLRLHILYGAFYWAVGALMGVPQTLTLKAAVMHFAAFSYAGQFYLFALVQIYFALALLVPERLWGSARLVLGALTLAASTVALLAWSFADGFSHPLLRPFVGQAEASASLWLYPFCLGMWAGRRFATSPRASAGAFPAWLITLLALAVVAFDLPATGGAAYVYQFPYVRWSVGIGATLLAFALPVAARGIRLRPVEALGRESFGIYVLNPLIVDLLRRLLGDVVTLPESLLVTFLTLAIAWLLTRALRERIPFAFA